MEKFISIEELKKGKFHEKLDLSEVIKLADSITEEIEFSDMTEDEKEDERNQLISELTEIRDELKKMLAESKERIKIQNN